MADNQGGGQSLNLSQQLKALGNAVRARFDKTGDLTLKEMTDIITPPKIYNGMVIYPGSDYKYDFIIDAVGDTLRTPEIKMSGLSVPFKLNKDCYFNFKFRTYRDNSYITNISVLFVRDNLKFRLLSSVSDTSINVDRILRVKIPANTNITSQDFQFIKTNVNYEFAFLSGYQLLSVTLTF